MKVLKSWLEEVKDAVYDADILFDEWCYKALKRRTQNKVLRTISRIFSRHVMAHKVRDMSKSIASIYNDANNLGIRPVKVAGGVTYEIETQDNRLNNLRERVDLQFFQGRDDDVEELTKLLCDPNNTNSHLTVIAIVGLAGLGKTTLSKHMCRVQEVINFFNRVVFWLVVSHNFNLMNLLKQMFEKVFGKASGGMDRQGLIDKLKEEMMGKKYLIILDDVWDTIEWDTLQNTLNEIGVSQGTTLLVTSRDQKVVETVKTKEKPTIYQLQELSPRNSWSLFMANYCREIVAGSEEEDIARRMIDKCRGVPLAIRVLADLLRDRSIKEWREIEESKIWTTKDENGILPSLRLSYNYLPHIALKKCFAFCAIFEEDEVIEKQKLISMWMAQGFLHPNDKMELEGEDYIEHLLNSSLFQDAELDRFGNVYAFKMHDLVWSLARVVSKGECLSSYRDDDDDDLDKVRYLLVSNNSVSRELTATSFKRLQTCMLNKKIENPSLPIWLRCKQLRVLAIGENWSENTDWKPLGRLIHLRYFEITAKFEMDIKQFNLPDQITKLYHLQTLVINILDLDDSSNTLFPKGLGNLVNLRHILIPHYSKSGVPMGLSHLTALQTLPVIKLGVNWGGRISDIGLLTNLRGIEIHLLTLLSVEEARSLNLGSKTNLDSLTLLWGDDKKKNPKANEILEALQPTENLQKLELRDFDGTTFPRWLVEPAGSPLNNIVILRIWCCQETDGNFKVENLMCLRILMLHACRKLTVTFPNNESQCCKSLEEMRISCCNKVDLPNLLLMSKLRSIQIRGNKSTSRDVLVGLGNLPCLNTLNTDLKLPVDLGEDSPVCKSLDYLLLDGSTYYNGDTTTDLPEQLQHLVALQSLWIENFESLEAIPNWLAKLTSLKRLYLYEMPKLKQLPPQDVMQSLSDLTSLTCSSCPVLEEDFKNKSGEWFKIAHIRLH